MAVGRIDANTGAVELDVTDRDNPSAAKSVFWIEISEKPLINLVWGGFYVMMAGGLLALVKRSREASRATVRLDAEAPSPIPSSPPKSTPLPAPARSRLPTEA